MIDQQYNPSFEAYEPDDDVLSDIRFMDMFKLSLKNALDHGDMVEAGSFMAVMMEATFQIFMTALNNCCSAYEAAFDYTHEEFEFDSTNHLHLVLVEVAQEYIKREC